MRTPRVAFFLASRAAIRSNRGIALTTIIMLLLIYLSLLFPPSLIQGASDRVDQQGADTLTSDIVITPAADATSIDDAGTLLDRVRKTPGVAHATAVERVGDEVTHGFRSGSWPVEAIDPVSFVEVFTTPSNIIEGRALEQSDGSRRLLGAGIAGAGRSSVKGFKASLQSVHADDTVAITLSNGQSATFTVAGIYDNQFAQSDSTAYITDQEAQTLLPAARTPRRAST